MATILLVENDLDLAEMLTLALNERGYQVWHDATSADAQLVLDHARPDLVVMDLMLPDRNGLLLCAEVKARAAAPIIVCSATRCKDDTVIGLQLGADDFLAKPFSVDDLDSRMRRLLRQAASGRNGSPVLQQLGSLTVDRPSCEVRLGGDRLPLTPTEYRLLCALIDQPGAVVSGKDLAERVWGFQDEAVLRSLVSTCAACAASCARAPEPGPALTARRGFGYQLLEHAPEATAIAS